MLSVAESAPKRRVYCTSEGRVGIDKKKSAGVARRVFACLFVIYEMREERVRPPSEI